MDNRKRSHSVEDTRKHSAKKQRQTGVVTMAKELHENFLGQLIATTEKLEEERDTALTLIESTGEEMTALRAKAVDMEKRVAESKEAPKVKQDQSNEDLELPRLRERLAEVEASMIKKEEAIGSLKAQLEAPSNYPNEQELRKNVQEEQLQLQISAAYTSKEEWCNTMSEPRRWLELDGRVVAQEIDGIDKRMREVLEILRRFEPENTIVKIYAPIAYPTLEHVEFDVMMDAENFATERAVKYAKTGEKVDFETAWKVVRTRLILERELVLWGIRQHKLFQDYPASGRMSLLGRVVDYFNEKFNYQVSKLTHATSCSASRKLILGGTSDTLGIEWSTLGPYNEEKLLALNLDNWKHSTGDVAYFSKIW